MEQELLHYLLAAFPKSSPTFSAEDDATGDYLVICGYRVPFESPVATDPGLSRSLQGGRQRQQQ